VSYCFRVPGVSRLTYEAALTGLQVRCETGATLSGDWVPNIPHRLYTEGVTTRSIACALQDGEFSVRLYSGACSEDYRLALRIAGDVARLAHTKVKSEEGVSFTPGMRGHRYGQGWIDDHVRTIGKVILRMAAAKRSDDPLVVEGPNRSFHMGPMTAAFITNAGRTDLERAEVMFSLMRKVQYPSVPILEPAAVVMPDSEAVVAAVELHPETSAVVQRTDVITFAAHVPAHVPWAEALQLLGPFVEPLDEWTVAIRAVPAEAWNDLLAAANDIDSAPFIQVPDGELTQHTQWSTQVTDAPTEVFTLPVARHDDTPVEEGVRRWWDVWRRRR